MNNKGPNRRCIFPFIPQSWLTVTFLKVERTQFTEYSLMTETMGGTMVLKLRLTPCYQKHQRKVAGLLEPVFFIYVKVQKYLLINELSGCFCWPQSSNKTAMLLTQELQLKKGGFQFLNLFRI